MIPAIIAAAGTIGGALIASHSGKKRDAVQYQRQLELNRENNKFNADEARKQRAAAAAAQTRQENYNSEVAQVQRLKQAGLNPALLYGGSTSSSGVSSMSAASASPSSYTPTGNQLDLGDVVPNALNALLQQAQVKNLETNTASQSEDVVSKQTTNKYIDAKSQLQNWELLEKINNLIKSGNLMDKDLSWYDRIKAQLMQQIEAQIAETRANTAYTSCAKTANTIADTGLKEAQTITEGTQQDLNEAKTITEGTQQDVNRENVNSQRIHQALEQMQTKVQDITEKDLQRKYGLDNAETQGFYKFCDKFGIPRAFAKGLMNLYGQFTNETGKGLGEFFSGDNWLNFFSRKYQVDKNYELGKEGNVNDRYRTDEWKPTNNNRIKQQMPTPDEIAINKKLSDGAPNDVVQTVPSPESANKEWNRKMKYLPDLMKNQLHDIISDRYPNWSKEQKDEFRKEFYYARSMEELRQIIHKYYYLK